VAGCVGVPDAPLDEETELDIAGSEDDLETAASSSSKQEGARAAAPASVQTAGECRFDTDDRTFLTACSPTTKTKPSYCTENYQPNYKEAQLWTAYLLGNSNSGIHKSASAHLKSLATCIAQKKVEVSGCGFAPAVENGPDVLWLRYSPAAEPGSPPNPAPCKDSKGQPVSPGTLLQRAVTAYRTANGSKDEIGPLASWSTLPKNCDAAAGCTYNDKLNDGAAYLDPSPAVITTKLNATTASVTGKRDGLNVKVYFWPTAPKACGKLVGGEPCSSAAIEDATPRTPKTIKGTMLKRSSSCNCVGG
jgi:hypothetical protein